MHNTDLDRVVFFSKEDLSCGYYLQKGEHILRNKTKSEYSDINEVLELYNLKKYIDSNIFLDTWTKEDIENFKQKATEYSKIVGQFMSTINDDNIIDTYTNTLIEYTPSFWEIFNNYKIFKQISKNNFSNIISKDPHLIHEILIHKDIVDHYNTEIKHFLLTHVECAEILISIYETNKKSTRINKYLPNNLTIEEKESIISDYLDSTHVNYSYLNLIQNARNKSNFKISDKTRLKAKRLYENKTKIFFDGNNGVKYGASVRFIEKAGKIKSITKDENGLMNYTYCMNYIKNKNNPYCIFNNFITLFEYLDVEGRISLVSKKNNMDVIERIMGVHSPDEYRRGVVFTLFEISSQIQLMGYNKVLSDLEVSLENALHQVFTSSLQEKYDFANNARFSIPTSTSYFEKVRLLAPEFESVLRQFKLFVENGIIDFELLQISSNPTSIKDIPSLNDKKYIYLNEDNKETVSCVNLFFSDQTLLAHVDPFKEKHYHTLFNLLSTEQVTFNNYENFQKPKLNYLIDRGFINIDSNGFIQITNQTRISILNDLYFNEVASFYRYPLKWRQEVLDMETEEIIYFGNSLFSKPEQSYFNYYLNKSEFTNGLDLRNSYLHGTQATPEEMQKHEHNYFTYLKLLILTFLKIEDDLDIYKNVQAN